LIIFGFGRGIRAKSRQGEILVRKSDFAVVISILLAGAEVGGINVLTWETNPPPQRQLTSTAMLDTAEFPPIRTGSSPQVIFTNPAIGAASVPTYTLVSATFSEDIDPTTLTSEAFSISRWSEAITGSIEYITASRVAVFYPGIPLSPSTSYTVTITTDVKTIEGEPLAEEVRWAFTTTDGTSPLDEGMRIYFGDLHSHSGLSDGRGTPSDAFKTARANGLDFFALTDHAEALTDEEWLDMLAQADAATIEGAFIGLWGFEWTSAKGHINVFNSDTLVRANDPNYDTLEEFYAWIAAQPDAIAQFNHPYRRDRWGYYLNFNDFAYDPSADERICLREMPRTGYPISQYLFSLNAGWHLGAVMNSDTHLANWGMRRYMGLVAPNLTKESILEALSARRTFAVSNRNFALVMQANGSWMGSVISNTLFINFTITAYDPDPTDPLLALVLYDNGIPVAFATPPPYATLYVWEPRIKGTAGHYYYVKAFHDVEGWYIHTYTSPVWTDTTEISIFYPLRLKGYKEVIR
jgi:hypothetical protein